MRYSQLNVLCAASLAFLIGCTSSGPDVSHVEGVVTLDGTPLPGAIVNFTPTEGSTGRPATGRTDDAGVYKLTDMQSEEFGSGAAAGEYHVTVVKVASGSDQQDEAASEEEEFDPNKTYAMKSEIPVKYNQPDTSGLTATVREGENLNVNFELTSK